MYGRRISGGLEVQPPKAVGFLQFEGFKQPKIYAKNILKAKSNNANLYCNLFPRFKKFIFSIFQYF